jgi:hypothetical protein
VEEGVETGRQRMRLARRLRPGPEPPVLLVFLGLAMWMFAPAWSSPTTRTLEGGDGDPAIFMWFMRWMAYALEHGHDLLVGGKDTGIRLPWAFFEDLPLLPSLITARLAQLTARFAGLLAAVFRQAVWSGGGWRRPAAVVVAIAVPVPLWPASTIAAEEVTTPSFSTGPAVRALPRDSVALVLPWAYRRISLAMTWQAEAGLWYRMPGGYFIGPS